MNSFDHLNYTRMAVNQRQLPHNHQTFPMWTAIQDCEEDDCIARSMCSYTISGTKKKCKVIMKYLRQVEKVILENYSKDMSEIDLFRVGMHLIPLYKQLARLKIVEMSLSSKDAMEITRSGTTKMHSLFKEIRECIRSIDSTWRELGIARYQQKEMPDIPRDANRGYYEMMERDALDEQKARKLKLVKRSG